MLGTLFVQKVLQTEGLPTRRRYHVAEDSGSISPPSGMAGNANNAIFFILINYKARVFVS